MLTFRWRSGRSRRQRSATRASSKTVSRWRPLTTTLRRSSFPVATCAAGLSATHASRVQRMPSALPSRNFLLRRLSALGLKSAKSAMTPLEYAAYTSTPIIPWIVRGDKLPIVNREEIAGRIAEEGEAQTARAGVEFWSPPAYGQHQDQCRGQDSLRGRTCS